MRNLVSISKISATLAEIDASPPCLYRFDTPPLVLFALCLLTLRWRDKLYDNETLEPPMSDMFAATVAASEIMMQVLIQHYPSSRALFAPTDAPRADREVIQ